MLLQHLPDELIHHVLLQCSLDELRRLKQACTQLRGAGRSMLRSTAWQATTHGAELGQSKWEGQTAGMPINAAHVDCLEESFRGDGIKAIAGCSKAATGRRRLMALTSQSTGLHGFECEVAPVAGANTCSFTYLSLPIDSVPQTFAADATHVYVVSSGTELTKFSLADLSSNPDTSTAELSTFLADVHSSRRSWVGSSSVATRLSEWTPDPTIDAFSRDGDFTRLRAACADERLYVACSSSRCVIVLGTADLSQLMVFDASRAALPSLAAERDGAAAVATVGVGAEDLEVVGDDRGWHVPMAVAVGEEFVFVAQRSCLHGRPDCVGAYRKETGELSHGIELDELGVEAVAVHHGCLYALTTGMDERRRPNIHGPHGVWAAGQQPPQAADERPRVESQSSETRQPMLHCMGLRGEQGDPGAQRISLLPEGYDGDDVHATLGSLYVDGPRGTLVVTLDADHEHGGHCLCIPLSLAGAV